MTETTALLCGVSVAGVVLRSPGCAHSSVSDAVFSLKLQPTCVVWVLLVLCYDCLATHVSLFAISCVR